MSSASAFSTKLSPSLMSEDKQQQGASTDTDPCTFLVRLPRDLLNKIVDYLELKDLSTALLANREFQQCFDQEDVYAQFAQKKFPVQTLNLDPYHGSWKRLLQDDNAENGLYVRRMFVLSQWRQNRRYPAYHYINAIRCMVWDRKSRQVHIGIEAFGNNDLRPAGHTSIFQLRRRNHPPVRHLGQRTLFRRRLVGFPEIDAEERLLHVKGVVQLATPAPFRNSHDLCLLTFDDKWFNEPDCQYRFTYNGSANTHGSDYECKLFLRESTTSPSSSSSSALQQYFQTGYTQSVIGINHCEFVPRDRPLLVPSNVMDWPKMAAHLETDDEDSDEMKAIRDRLIPPTIRELHARGLWGVVTAIDRI